MPGSERRPPGRRFAFLGPGAEFRTWEGSRGVAIVATPIMALFPSHACARTCAFFGSRGRATPLYR